MMFKQKISRSISVALGQFLLCGALAAGFVGALSLSTLSASAQLAGKGAVTGTVQDPSGAVVPGATITITNPATGFTLSATSASAGEFTLSPLDAGIYVITVKATGFESITQKDVHVNALETFTYAPILTVGGTDQTITVDTAPPALETSNATLGGTMEQELYSSLPIEMGAYGQADQRRATDFAFLMPGVQGNNTTGNATTNTGIVNGSGSRGGVSAVYVDGTPFVRAGGNGDPRYVWTAISVDAVDQFQVQTSGYSAIYEGQGIQNYTVKQGGKQYHGAVYEFFRNTALDSYGFFGALPNPATGLVHKPIEHSNEYGINLSGPLVPFGAWKDKVFFFGNYNGFRYASETPTQQTFPTPAQQKGDFSATGIPIYDPSTQTACTANSTNGPCRYQYGYGYGGTAGAAGNPVKNGQAINVIPASEFSSVALKMQSYLPAGISAALQNNYVAPNRTGLTNWSTTDRIDYNISQRNLLTLIGAIGRQASSNPVGQTTAGRNVANIPYNYGQTYAPKTAVGIIEDTFTINTHLVNQFKYGYARYNGPTFNADQLPPYSATAQGISGQPLGQASAAFPITTYAGTDAPTNWAGTTASATIAQNYTLLDTLQWVKGPHTISFGGQIAWLLYNVNNATGGSTPITLANAVTETAGITASTNAKPAYAAAGGTGLSYASFLIGQIDKTSFTSYLQQTFGTRFRAISPYVQDNWKVNQKLTLDLGLRWDYFPTLREVHDAQSFFNPALVNPITGVAGSLQFAGNGANTCNCDTPVSNWYKNFGPRLGAAYQVDRNTVFRASWGVMFTHGNAVGGSATSLGTLGFSAAPSFSASGTLLSTAPFTGTNGAIPAYTLATGVASGPAYGTGYTNTAGYTGTPSGMGYADSYLGSRAPEYVNWTFGMQHVFGKNFTFTATYVGSQGHFLPADGTNARGFWADQLDPKYLYLGSNLNATGSALTTFCAANTSVCPSYYPTFNTSQSVATLLKPFPFQSVSDSFGYVANSNYNALQTIFNYRAGHGLTFFGNYTWSRSIDDGGTFRSGYAIPAGTIVNQPNATYTQDRIERSVSTSNQPHHVVMTGVYDLPFGKTILNGNSVERAILGGFHFSEIFQAFSGSPLAITGSACQTNPAQSTCAPTLNPNFTGNARVGKHWGQGITAANTAAITYITPSIGSTTIPNTGPFISPVAPTCTAGALVNSNGVACPTALGATLLNTGVVPSYTFGNAARTAPLGLTGPGNYTLDLSLKRTFHLYEHARLNLSADWYNITNHTFFAVASTAVGNASFGQVTANTSAPRKSVQLSGRIEF